ncbi:MAG: hypothetical protein K0S86_2607 [Geminicoccaceae bacterium]|jgi:hypothetical protein|nr:hypothetical protein [Geminicoccaceae bacterium]
MDSEGAPLCGAPAVWRFVGSYENGIGQNGQDVTG